MLRRALPTNAFPLNLRWIAVIGSSRLFLSGAFYKNDELDKVIDDIDDVAFLGSAIFSHWRYVTHWAHYSSLLDEEHRPWFITAFGRLAVITEEDVSTFIFEGNVQKIQLISICVR